jgi:hypothetical protein
VNGLIYYHRLRYPGISLYAEQKDPLMIETTELALSFGKYHGWGLSAVVASDPNYCRWLLKQPFVRREFPALRSALEALALPQGRVRVVRVERRTLGSCEVYTFPDECIVRRAASVAKA